ncbi:hypothetical protein NEOLEDRAFT_281022 [Neolentinus lepideus HHB14362 ss-1]|uniref:Uncharacterized protein n=1 Tax=Neolentinus lepideus HHB14362 ss-1 TaxID=1314782 RepID=A0A165SYL6_9AGAM|nr:hypothetical protein NEOLEDRAFT_281022 [Neolentinus lepideus HHB14362 ss-1]
MNRRYDSDSLIKLYRRSLRRYDIQVNFVHQQQVLRIYASSSVYLLERFTCEIIHPQRRYCLQVSSHGQPYSRRRFFSLVAQQCDQHMVASSRVSPLRRSSSNSRRNAPLAQTSHLAPLTICSCPRIQAQSHQARVAPRRRRDGMTVSGSKCVKFVGANLCQDGSTDLQQATFRHERVFEIVSRIPRGIKTHFHTRQQFVTTQVFKTAKACGTCILCPNIRTELHVDLELYIILI